MPCFICGLAWGGYGKLCTDCVGVDKTDPYYYEIPVSYKPPPETITLASPATLAKAVDYAFTLTAPPDMELTTEQFTASASKILKHGISSKYEHPTRSAYVLEFTEKGTPHIHGVYTMANGRRITQKYFKRYWPLWDESIKLGHGHRGGYHQKARHSESYEVYMEKEGIIISC